MRRTPEDKQHEHLLQLKLKQLLNDWQNRGFDEKNKKEDRVKHDKRNLNRSPYLVSTLGIYYLTFLSLFLFKIFFDHFDFSFFL